MIWHDLAGLPGESLGELRNGIFQGPGETATAPLDHHCSDAQDGAQQGEPELRIRDEENEGGRPQYLKKIFKKILIKLHEGHLGVEICV